MWKIQGTPAIFSLLIFFSLAAFTYAQFFTKPWVNCKSAERVKSASEEARLLCVLNPGQSPWKAETLWELSVLEFNICKQQACLSENFAGCILANLPKSLEALISSMEEITKFMYQYVSSI